MAHPFRWPVVYCCLLLAYTFTFTRLTTAQTVWSGLTKSFTKNAGSDPTLPQNQDSLTADVILTRGPSGGGLYNIAAEGFYSMNISPALTAWATDLNNPGKTITATNWQNLAFIDWIDAYGGSHSAGGSIASRNAVVRLTSDNVYLDLRFTSWESGGGGGYTYLRAEPPTSSPTGDYNANGTVDAADYVLWRKNPTGFGGDPAGYNTWRAHFGQPPGSGAGAISNATVPEPSTLVLLMFAAASCCLRRSPAA
jgi:hypothetical protein